MFRPHQPPFFGKSIAVISLCAFMALSGCSYISKTTDKITGDSVRNIPDTGMVPLGARRAPVLNPGGAKFNANHDMEEQKILAENPYMNEGMKVSSDKVASAQYSENTVPGQQTGNWKGNVFHGSDSADPSARRQPQENQSMMMQPPTVMAAPVESLAPVQQAYNEMAPVVVPPVAPLSQPIAPVALAPIPTMGRDGYPDLAATPTSPVVQPGNYQNSMNNLVAERELAESMRREMMQNPAAIQPDMAEPGMPIASAPAAPVQPKSDAEFKGWLKNMFTENDSASSVPPAQMAAGEQRRPIAPAYIPPSAPIPEPQMQAGLEPIVLTPPPSAEPMPELQMASAAPALEPITLAPPPTVASDYGTTGLDVSAEPIMLQPPQAVMNRNVRFLPDGRYASRRGSSRMAMAR